MSDLAYPKIKKLMQYIFNEEFQNLVYDLYGHLDETCDLLQIFFDTEFYHLKDGLLFKPTSKTDPKTPPEGFYKISKPGVKNINSLGVYVRDVTDLYTFFETSAPVDYDGFGTITVAELKPEEGLLNQWGSRKKVCRLVAVRKDAVNWQTMRYASGCYGAVEVKPEFEV